MIEPEVGILLIQLASSKYGAISTDKKNYKDEPTFGKVIAVNPDDETNKRFMGRTVYYRQFKDDCRTGDDKLALIEVKDVMGSSDASTLSNS